MIIDIFELIIIENKFDEEETAKLLRLYQY